MSKSYLVASGKGGVGKSTIAANLAFSLVRMGKKVCIIDTDIGLRDQDALLGLENRIVYDLVDVLNRQCSLDQALISPLSEPELSLLPASQFDRVRALDPKRFARLLIELKKKFDFVLIDCPAGIEKGLRNILKSGADDIILICTPDDVCIRNVDRVRALVDEKKLPRPLLIVNRLDSELVRSGEQYSAQVVSEILDLPLLGEIPYDTTVYRCQLKHMFFADVDSEARNAIRRIACRLKGETIAPPNYGTEKTSWLHRILHRSQKEVVSIDR